MGATAKESDLVQIVLLVFGRHPPSLLTFFGGGGEEGKYGNDWKKKKFHSLIFSWTTFSTHAQWQCDNNGFCIHFSHRCTDGRRLELLFKISLTY